MSVPICCPPPPWYPSASLISHHPSLHHLLSCNSMPHFIQIHSLSITTASSSNTSAFSLLLSFPAFSPSGSLPYALRLFTLNPSSHPFFTNLLLRASAQSRQLSLFQALHAVAIKLSHTSHLPLQNSLLQMYSSFNLISPAILLYRRISDSNDASTNIMLGAYFNCGLLDDAWKLFDEMPERKVISWSVMINGLVRNSLFTQALELFRVMLGEKVDPNESVYVGVLSACAHLGAVRQGRWIENHLRRRGFAVTVRIGTALIDMYLKSGCLLDAFRVFDEMPEKNSMTWSAMIAGLAINGCGEESLDLFSSMVVAGIPPNEVTFVGVLNACSHSRLIDEGAKHFESMFRVYGIRPNVQHYCCLVDLYGRAGMLAEAEEVVDKMPMKPNSAVWGSLLSACRLRGDEKLIERVGKKLLELDPENSGRYVLLSNIYARRGMWEEVGEIRRMMKERGVVKTPGSSFVDLDGEIHEFMAGDSFHPEKTEVYAKIEEMRKRLKTAGYKPRIKEVLIDIEEEDEKESSLYHHSEKLALAFGLIRSELGTTIRITKNIRVCDDCHLVMKMISKIYRREIVVRDRSRFHHFKDGDCSCNDYW